MEQDAGISSLPLFISNSVSFHVSTIHRMCPTSRRQYADFLVFLTSPLHRQYKTARTETRWHLLLKAWQMPTQTSASRGYVLFISDVRNTQKSLNCLSACGHIRGVLKTWKNTDYRRCKKRQGRNSVLCDPNFPACFYPECVGTLSSESMPPQNVRMKVPLRLPRGCRY